MPNRIIREGILTSDRVNSLDWEAEVFYRRLLSIVDDFGRYDARPAVLRANLYSLKLDSMKEDAVQRCLTSLAAAQLIILYSVDGKAFLEVTNFNQQVRSKRSRFPSPDKHLHSICIADAQHMHTKTETESESYTEEENCVLNRSTVVSDNAGERIEQAPECFSEHESEKRTESTLEASFDSELNNLPHQVQNKQEGGKELHTEHLQQEQCYPKRLNDVRNVKFAENEVCMGNSPETARFMVACLSIHPSWNRTVPTAIEQAAALEAYRSAAGKISQRDIDLLKAYYASTLTSDKYGVRFWRPDSRKSFWNNFGDIITHADRWAKETRWKHPKDKKKNLLQPKPEEEKTMNRTIVNREEAVKEIASLTDLIGKPMAN